MGGLEDLRPDHLFDGGDLDCGSGLVLLIREHMSMVPDGGVLELRSVEGSVADDLPPWCRMVGHEYLGALAGEARGQQRFFLRKGAGEAVRAEAEALQQDKERARGYEWRLRARAAGGLATSIYCRNFRWTLGQPASFEERDDHPSAVEALLGAVAGDVVTAFGTACSRAGLDVDDIELTVRGRLHDSLAPLGLSDGDPSLASVALKLYASTFADEATVRAVWDDVIARSPLVATLRKATEVECDLAVV